MRARPRGAGEELDEPERRAVTEAEIDDLARVRGFRRAAGNLASP
ncbi:MAG TPA: hypothetical protein VFV73_08250 [Streptosporangiaceae bacterium]|nr:hypothetical protein [Streptosporangiaceae bacterium]